MIRGGSSIKLASWFETRKRPSGETFVTFRDRDATPDWIKDALRDAHCGDAPDDWIYEECLAACQAIDEGAIRALEDYGTDDIDTHVDARVDVYTQELFQWAADHCLGTVWCNAEEEFSDMGGNVDLHTGAYVDTSKRLSGIQFCAIRAIVHTIVSAHEAHARAVDAMAGLADF